MQQLSGLDASFLYFETANAPMHIGGVAIYDQSTAPGGRVTFNRKNFIRGWPQMGDRRKGLLESLPALTAVPICSVRFARPFDELSKLYLRPSAAICG